MSNDNLTRWVEFARRVQSIAQAGEHYTTGSVYDRERYEQLAALAAEMFSTLTDSSPDAIKRVLADDEGYRTPKVDVRGGCFRDGKLLMVHERDIQKWALPGGWADVIDTPAEAVEREIREESGFEAKVTKVVGIYHRDHPRHGYDHHLFAIYKIYFLCEITGGEPHTSIETDQVEFFAEDDLPAELATGKVTVGHLHTLFEHYRNPTLPAEFD